MTVERLAYVDWMARGKALFGERFSEWKFRCPLCGHVQAVGDFKQHTAAGATPNSAAIECIGRYLDKPRSAMFGKGPGPCDYASYGLFNCCPVLVVFPDGKETPAFAFAEPRP